jgi:hypothetical protein
LHSDQGDKGDKFYVPIPCEGEEVPPV